MIGLKDFSVNDIFCRCMVKVCNVIVIVVGYRLVLEYKCFVVYEDGFEVLYWLVK